MGIFHNEAAITRLVDAILLEQNDEWPVQRSRHITPDCVAPIGDDPLVSLPTLEARSSRPKPVIVVALSKLHHAVGHDRASSAMASLLPQLQSLRSHVRFAHSRVFLVIFSEALSSRR